MQLKFTLVSLVLFAFTAIGLGQTPARTVKGRELRSTSLPEVKIKFRKEFKFVGSTEFVLYDRAKAEQFFFVDADGKKIKRLFMVQFEGFLNGIDGTYNYNEPRMTRLGKRDFFSNAEFIPDVEMALKAVPGSDIARASEFLANKGFKLMSSLVFQRFVDVVDAEKRNEVIILYIEAASADSAKAGLDSRALKNFKVSK